MKNLIYLFGFFMALLISSCSQDEVFYSCNEEEDAFVKDNLKEVQKMTRGEWLESSQDLKLPMYRAFTAEKKQQFWKEKIEKVMNGYDWTEEELSHLVKLYDAINEHKCWFVDEKRMSENELEEFELHGYRWTEYAKNELLWSDRLVGSIVYIGEDIEIVDKEPIVKSITFVSKRRIRSAKESLFGDCNCTYRSDMFCPGGCKEGPGICDKTETGCGYLLGSPCTGFC